MPAGRGASPSATSDAGSRALSAWHWPSTRGTRLVHKSGHRDEFEQSAEHADAEPRHPGHA